VTAADPTGIGRTAAEAALQVPGVAELQLNLRDALAGAATRVQRTLGSPALPPERGVRAERTPRDGAWHVEVRCVLHAGRRPLDTARDVHERVRSAVDAQLTSGGTPGPVTVTVTVTRVTGPRR
jgi:hypothetical protein